MKHFYSTSPCGKSIAHDSKAERDNYVKEQNLKGEWLVKSINRKQAFQHGIKWPQEKRKVIFLDKRYLWIDGYIQPADEMKRK